MDTTTPSADHDLLIEVNANVKNLNHTMQSFTSATNTMMTDHETRLRALESDNSQLKGTQKSQRNMLNAVSIIGGLLAIAITVIQFIRG